MLAFFGFGTSNSDDTDAPAPAPSLLDTLLGTLRKRKTRSTLSRCTRNSGMTSRAHP